MPWVLLTKSMAKSVDMATRIPRLFRTYALSSDASAELVPQTAQLSASERILPGISLTRPTRILASCAKTSDTAAHNHHPEQAIHSALVNLLPKLSNKRLLRNSLISTQTYPRLSFPWAAVAMMIPKMRKNVANTIPVRRPSFVDDIAKG